MLLVYTSLTFLSVPVHAIFAKEMVIYTLVPVLTGASIVTHAGWNYSFVGKRTVHAIDKVLAHFLYFYVVAQVTYAPSLATIPVYVTFLWVCYLYYFTQLCWLAGGAWKPWHATVHAGGVLACHSYLLTKSLK